MSKAWKTPEQAPKGVPTKSFTFERIRIIKKEKIEKDEPIPDHISIDLCDGSELAYRVVLEKRPEWLSPQGHMLYTEKARQLAYDWFVFEFGDEIAELCSKNADLSIGVSFPYQYDLHYGLGKEHVICVLHVPGYLRRETLDRAA